VNIPTSHNSSGWHKSLKRYLKRNKIKLSVSLCFKLTNRFDGDPCDAIRWIEHFEYHLASKVYFIYLTCFIQLLLLQPDHPHDLNALDLQDETGPDSVRPLNSQIPNILLQFSTPPTEYPTKTFTQRSKIQFYEALSFDRRPNYFWGFIQIFAQFQSPTMTPDVQTQSLLILNDSA